MKAVVFLGSFFSTVFCFAANAETKMDLISGPYGSGQIFVECGFDATKLNCQLDTGASATFIQQNPTTSSIPKVGTREFKTAAGATLECDEVQVGQLHVLDTNLNDRIVVRCPAPMKSTVGMDVIQNTKQYFDFKNAAVSVFEEFPSGSKKFDLKILEKGLFTVAATIAGVNLPAIWDTGAGLTSISRDFVSGHPDAFEFVKSLGDGADTSGNPLQADLYKLKRFEVGGQIFEDLSVLVLDFSPIKKKMGMNVDFILGYNALVLRNWRLDLVNGKFAVE